MTVTFVGTDIDGSDSTTSVSAGGGGTISYEDDDLLVALIHLNGTGLTLSDKQGFSTLSEGDGDDSNGSSYWVGYKTAASESGDFTWTFSSTRASVRLLQFHSDTTTFETDDSDFTSTFETSSTTTEFTDIDYSANSVVIAWHLEDNNTPQGLGLSSDPTGYTNTGGIQNNQVQDSWYDINASSGTTSSPVATWNGANRHFSYHFGFKEAAGGGGGGGTSILLPLVGTG